MSLDVLAFFAHPDDETMLCGGTLALLAAQGARVHVLVATRGEGGELGEPPVCAREQIGSVRENELRCAVQALGAASLTLMNYIDPLVGPGEELYAFSDNLDEVAAQVVEAARVHRAGAIITHGVNGEYGHPAHLLAHQAALAAAQRLAENAPLQAAPLLYTAQATFPAHPHPRLANADAPAHLVVDITPVLPQKTAAALCHLSQNALFVRRQSEEAGRKLSVPEVIHTLEGMHRVMPAFAPPGKIHDALADLLWASGCAQAPAHE